MIFKPLFSKIAISDNSVVDTTADLGNFNDFFKSIQNVQQWFQIETLACGSIVALNASPCFAKDGTLALTTNIGKILVSDNQGKTKKLTINGKWKCFNSTRIFIYLIKLLTFLIWHFLIWHFL